MRYFAIINTHKDIDLAQNLLQYIQKEDTKIIKFTFDTENKESDVVIIPKEMEHNDAKIINYVQKYFFDNNIKEFVHVIKDNIKILQEPSEFLKEIEYMMSKLELYEWYNTATDPMNYTFKVYNPRFSVDLDSEDVKKVYDKTIIFTSHSNTNWICYDFSKCTPELINLDENFEIPMYHIIKHLAEKRNHKRDGEIAYMNFYPTIIEEVGTFSEINMDSEYKTSPEENQKEAQLFQEQNINHQADMAIEKIMDDILGILLK